MALLSAGAGIFARTFVFLSEYLDIKNIWDVILTLLDLCIVAFAAYKIMQLFRDSRAKQIGKGILFILCIAILANILNLTTVSYVVNLIVSILPVAVVVLFQSEFRRLFEGVGHTKISDYFRSDRDKSNDEIERIIDEVAFAAEDFAENRIGALLVFEKQTNLGEVISSGTILDATVTSALIRQIFVINTPLHDGATIIRNNRIYASGCFLPLTTDATLNKELGTRHRAGIGVTEISDCITIIVSEETGVISVARNGSLTRDIDTETLKKILRDNLIVETTEKKTRRKFALKKGNKK